MDSKEFDNIINEYGKDIYSFCLYLTRNKEDADDLYQDSNPKSYLLTIATNVWNNHKRKFLWRKNKSDIDYMTGTLVTKLIRVAAIILAIFFTSAAGVYAAGKLKKVSVYDMGLATGNQEYVGEKDFTDEVKDVETLPIYKIQ